MTQKPRTTILTMMFALSAIIMTARPCAIALAETREFPDPAKPGISWLPENTSVNPASSTNPIRQEAAEGRLVTVGKASYYGKEFNGRKTASGEYFNLRHFTAAHRTLAFGTNVRVINLENGRNVVVRINDRGPFMKGRIIDISPAAAKEIGLTGTANVRIEAYN